jgi:hypothetical protein
MIRQPHLARAADIIQTNGLAREYYVLERPGGLPPARCPVCPRGAIALAVGQDPRFVVDWPNYCRMTTAHSDPRRQAERAARAEIITAEKAFARYLREELGFTEGAADGVLIENWTDTGDRSQTQVVGALLAAAEYDGRAS